MQDTGEGTVWAVVTTKQAISLVVFCGIILFSFPEDMSGIVQKLGFSILSGGFVVITFWPSRREKWFIVAMSSIIVFFVSVVLLLPWPSKGISTVAMGSVTMIVTIAILLSVQKIARVYSDSRGR